MGAFKRLKDNFTGFLTKISSFGNERSVTFSGPASFSVFGPDFYSPSNPTVSEQSAVRLSAVYSCLNVLGNTMGAVPCEVKKATKKGCVKAYDNPIFRLVNKRPNPYTVASDFWRTMEVLCRAWGNSFAYIERDRFMTPVGLWLMMPWHTQILRNGSPVTSSATYDIGPSDSIYYWNNGAMLPASDVIHFKNFSWDGIVGISAIRQNALTVSQGLKLQQYNTTIINTKPPGYLSAPVKPKDQASKDNIKKMWTQDQQGTENLGGIPLLYGGIEYKSLPLPADDVAYIESIKANKQDICGIFNVPPSLIQDYTSTHFNNAEQQDIVFVKYTVNPMIAPKEQELSDKLFPEANKKASEPYEINFDTRQLLRGDLKAQQEFFHSMIQDAVLTPNQVLEELGYPEYDGGDEHYIQSATVPLSLLKQVLLSKKATTGVSADKKEQLKAKFNGRTQEIMDILNG